MKYILVVFLAIIALVSAGRVLDDELERQKAVMKARINTFEAKVEADIKHFDTTKLKDSSDQKELKDTRIELEQHKVELTKVISPDDLEPIGDRMTYLEDWEPSQVARMEDKLHH